MSANRIDPTLSSPGGEAFSRSVRRGLLVAGRYALVQPLGRGGHGEVWEAEDSLGRQLVAVKLFRSGDHAHAARVRREIAVLRMLRLPGVVSMLDEGVDGEWPYMVMERVEGEPFPGRAQPVPWEALADGAQRLLEIVGRIHAAAVIHRDLKPSNVLVGGDGRVTVLDFGLSFPQASSGDRLTMDFEFMGTPAYLAPEQLTGDSIGPETDLYAIGVMLYEALSATLPHPNTAIRGMLADRLTRRPRSLDELVPSIPAAVNDTVMQLLEIDPAARPRSADLVLQRLRAQRASASRTVPRLGGDGPVRAVLEAARSGRSVDVIGPSGSGRTRLLDDVELLAREASLPVVRARASSAPLSTVRSLLDDGTPIDAGDELSAVLDRVVSALIERSRSGALLLVDDVDKCDSLSQRAFARAARVVPVVRVLASDPFVRADECVRLSALSARDIEPLFVGPERLFHLRSEGAQRLIERTDGRPRAVLEEIDAWVRAGLCRWDDGRVVIDRTSLDRISLDARPMRARLSARPPRASADPSLPSHLVSVAQWLDLAGADASTTVLVELTREPRWQVEAALDELEERGVVRFGDDRTPILSAAREALEPPHESRSAAHRRLAFALPRGRPGRFLHLLAAGANEDPSSADEVVAEAVARSGDLAREGRIGLATVLLSDALRSLRPLVETSSIDPTPLFVAWVEVAVSSGALSALDAVLYEITRVGARGAMLASLEQLVRAALAVSVWDDRAASLVEAVAPFDHRGLELARATVRVLAARRVSLEVERARVDEVIAALAEDDSPAARARCAQWMGRLAYRIGHFSEAAAHHREAARLEPWLSQRVVALLDAASASMEAFDLAQAERDALAALGLAIESRNTLLEGRAEWLLRAVAWRGGGELSVDHTLIEAVSALGAVQLEALVCLSEAAVAWRAGERECAASLAERAYHRWSAVGEPFGSLLAGALAHACGRALSPEALRSVIERARECTSPGVGVQALSLLAEAGVDVALDELELERLVSGVAPEHWDRRMDLCSVRDALARIRVRVIEAP
jgi:serine/threonine protein kinase